MKKIICKVSAMLLCSASLVCPFNVSAEVGDWEEVEVYSRTAPDLTVETEDFQYHYYIEEVPIYDIDDTTGELTEIDCGTRIRRAFTSDLTDAGYMVTGVFCKENTDDATPIYTLLPINTANDYATPAYISGRNLEAFLGEETLEIGDLLYVERVEEWSSEDEYEYIYDNHFLVAESKPGQYILSGVTNIENVGNAFDLFGDSFRAVAQNELYLAPNYVVNASCYDGHLYYLESEKVVELKGDVLDDGKIGVTDVIALNKSLSGVKPLTGVQSFLAADMNCDTTVDVFDLILLKKEVLSK